MKRLIDAKSDSARHRVLSVQLSLGITDKPAAVCELKADPTTRTSLIRGFKGFPGDLENLANTLEKTQDVDLRSALCVAIGSLGSEATDVTQPVLTRLFVNAPDAGTHGAADWALRQQGLDQEALWKLLQAAPPEAHARQDWEIVALNKEPFMTMLKIPVRKFAMGLVNDDENPSGKDASEELPVFWMSDREVSVGQFHAILKKSNQPADMGTRLLPMRNVSWFDAVEFCNELSRLQGLTPCYTLDKIVRDKVSGETTSADVAEKGGKGYRLPTEREWEYACRALSATNYNYGDDESLLAEMAVFNTKVQACATKPPNGWGLFNMHGNVSEWCSDKFSSDGDSRVLRGGSFSGDPQYLRSALRNWYSPDNRSNYFGFRVSKTP